MSLTEGNLSAADIAAVTGNNGGFGFGNDGAWWILILFLFAFMGGGWGNSWGGGNVGAVPYMVQQNDFQRGFDQQQIMSGISGINSAIANSSANAEVSRCNLQANVLQALNNNQNANTAAMNSIALGLQGYANASQAGIADIKYTVATEACNDRQSVSDGIRDIIAAQNANTQAIINSQNSGFQALEGKLCQLELDSYKQQLQASNAENVALRTAQAQDARTAQILADNAAQTANLIRTLNPTPIPAYTVQNPACCNVAQNAGCACGLA